MTQAGVASGPDVTTIRLHQVAGAPQIDGRNVFFTFASGRLSYDCVSCGAKCCRGFGYIVNTQYELARHIQGRRALPLFFAPTSVDSPVSQEVSNCAPGCFSLADDGRCEVHVRQGYEAKPETCRLFPFNNLRLAGQFLIVSPHASLCPIEIAPEGAESACSSHEVIRDDLAARGFSARVAECAPGATPFARTIEAERRIVDLSDTYLGRADALGFLQASLDVAHAFRVSPDPASILAFVDFAREMLGTPPARELGRDPQASRTLIACTPYLRAQFAFPAEIRDGSDRALWLSAERLPFAVLGVYLIAEAARALGMKRVTFQTLSKIQHQFRPVLWLLAYWDTPMTWRTPTNGNFSAIEGPRQRFAFMKLARELTVPSQRRHPAPLGELLLRYAPSDEVARIGFLKTAARHLAGVVQPSVGTNHDAQRRKGPRGSVYGWLLSSASDDLLRVASGRLGGSKS